MGESQEKNTTTKESELYTQYKADLLLLAHKVIEVYHQFQGSRIALVGDSALEMWRNIGNTNAHEMSQLPEPLRVGHVLNYKIHGEWIDHKSVNLAKETFGSGGKILVVEDTVETYHKVHIYKAIFDALDIDSKFITMYADGIRPDAIVIKGGYIYAEAQKFAKQRHTT